MPRRNSFYATKTTINGQSVELKAIFDYLDEGVNDPEVTFERMIYILKDTDENIKDKVESLKFQLSQERPDEFIYIPDSDYGPSSIKKKPEPPKCRVEKTPDITKALKWFVITLAILILTTVIITIAAFNTSEPPTKPKIHIEKLEPL